MAAAHKSAVAKPPAPTEPAIAETDPWVSLNTAAEIRGKARNTVLLEALDGQIRHQKVAGRRFFHRDDLERLAGTQSTNEDED